MKRKLYTRGLGDELLGRLDLDARFTPEEHAFVTESQESEEFTSRDRLIRWYLSRDAHKLSALAVLIDRLYRHPRRAIVSLGATEFDRFYVERAQQLFPNLTVFYFDFCRDDSATLSELSGIKLDAAVFFGSSYVMTDDELVACIRGLWNAGVEVVFDFHAGAIASVPQLLLREWRSRLAPRMRLRSALARIRGQDVSRPHERGKLHGYLRSRRELRALYSRAGAHIDEELTAVGGYPYSAVLSRRH